MNQWAIEFTKAMKGLTVMYGKQCTPEMLELYETILRPLTVEQLVLAVRLWIEDPKHVFFPLPAQLKSMVVIKMDPENEAAMVVEQICYAQASYGTDSIGMERARKKIGELGWSLIEMKGGWNRFWHELQEGVDGTIKSQLRKALIGLMDQKKQGDVNKLALGDFGLKLPTLDDR